MPDIRLLLDELTRVIANANFPDVTGVAEGLNLDLSQARITKAKTQSVCINGARLNGTETQVGVVCGIAPWRQIWLFFLIILQRPIRM